MNLYAAVDIGTNSCRLLIAEKKNKKIIPRQMVLRTTRLGENLINTGKISKDAMVRTSDALLEFKQFINKFENVKVKVAATSAAREAKNSKDFFEFIKDKTDLDVNIITGKEEAYLSYCGAVNAVACESTPVVLDIGGGSTELMYLEGKNLKASSSGVGAVYCTEDSSTPTEIIEKLSKNLDGINKLKAYEIIGVGGTITTLAAIHQELKVYDPRKIQNYILKRKDVDALFFKLCGLTLAERKKLPGLQPQRADIIVAGTLILWVIMTYLDVEKIQVSEADILHGIIMDME
jgi:exopolyphosphatase/guanosine-5'-triphosphate,3'-diphosphate pyrophosphatase